MAFGKFDEFSSQDLQENKKNDFENALQELTAGVSLLKTELFAEIDGSIHAEGGPRDPKEILDTAAEQYKLGLLKKKATDTLSALKPVFDDSKDTDLFRTWTSVYFAKVDVAPSTKALFQLIQEAERELQTFNTTKKITVGEQTQKIGKKEQVPTALGLKKYEQILPQDLFYSIEFSSQEDSVEGELKQNVDTIGRELKSATDTYRSTSNTLAEAYKGASDLAMQQIELDKEYEVVLGNIQAAIKNNIVGDDKYIGLQNEKTSTEERRTALQDAINQKKDEVNNLTTALQIAQSDLDAKQVAYTAAVEQLIDHQIAKQKDVLDQLAGAIQESATEVSNNVSEVTGERREVEQQITDKQREYAALRFAPDKQLSVEDAQQLHVIQQEIIDLKSQLATQMDVWINTYAQQGVNIQALYVVHKEVSTNISEMLLKNIGNINTEIGKIDGSLLQIDAALQRTDADIAQNETTPEKLPPLLALRAQFVDQKRKVTEVRAGLEKQKTALETRQVTYAATAVAAESAGEYVVTVSNQRVVNFLKERELHASNLEQGYKSVLQNQKQENNKQIDILEENKILLDTQKVVNQDLFNTAKKAFEENPNDDTVNSNYATAAKNLTIAKNAIEVNLKLTETYQLQNTEIDKEITVSEERIAGFNEQIASLGTQINVLKAQLAQVSTSAVSASFPEPSTYVTANMPEKTPFQN